MGYSTIRNKPERRVSIPVLLVEGTESSFKAMGPEAERRGACFANARKAVIEGAGHMLQRHRPVPLAELLLEFLGGSRPSPCRPPSST